MALRDYFIAPPDEADAAAASTDAAGERPAASTDRTPDAATAPEAPPADTAVDPARERAAAAADRAPESAIAPAPAAAPSTAPAAAHLLRRLIHGAAHRRGDAAAQPALAPSLGVLASPRDVAAVGIAAGLVLARRSPAVLVVVHSSDASLIRPAVRAPTRPAAARLAASLRARGLAADARGRIAMVDLTAESDHAAAAARALAAAGALSSVLALAVRDPGLDAHLAAQDAILVALPPSTDPALAALAASSAARLARRSAPVALSLDPVSRTLALAALRAPAPVRTAVEGLVG